LFGGCRKKKRKKKKIKLELEIKMAMAKQLLVPRVAWKVQKK
jgi:hypothetical protein